MRRLGLATATAPESRLRSPKLGDTGCPMLNPRPFQVMTKPNGPRCNLDCTYCYYLEKERLYPDENKFRMPDDVLETYVRDYIAAQVATAAPDIWFSWQGGEPTLLGIDFFRRAIALQQTYAPPGRTVRNALQTNGTLLDEEWACFLKANDVLVGLSIDGPRDLHDRYRIDRAERPSFDKVMAAVDLLRTHQVEFNALTVVHRHNARQPREVYRFLKEIGIDFMQFIPIVERSHDGATLAGAPQQEPEARVTPWSVLPRDYGAFLCRIFDEWVKADVGRVFVQFFDVQLGLWAGGPSSLCWFAETCGQGLALEHNGDLYACDHYVYPDYRLGNIMQTPMATLAATPMQDKFGTDKRDTLPRQCRACEYRFACNGGCPKHRVLTTADGEPGLNYFCESYLRFFAHAGPHLRAMAALLHRGRPAAEIMDIANQPRQANVRTPEIGRNDPCPCGSGKKLKHCCRDANAALKKRSSTRSAPRS
jgi:uncharacterized protein